MRVGYTSNVALLWLPKQPVQQAAKGWSVCSEKGWSIWSKNGWSTSIKNGWSISAFFPYGGAYTPVNGVLFGDPDMGLVLRGAQVNSNLTVNPTPISNLPETPNGILEGYNPNQETTLLAYPNPTSNHITVEYTTTKAGDVSIELYDVLGSNLASLYNGYSEAGNYSLRYSPHSTISGVYFFVLKSETESKTHKVIFH